MENKLTPGEIANSSTATTIGGAAIGLSIGGAVGAIIGGVVGAFIPSTAAILGAEVLKKNNNCGVKKSG